MLINVTGCTADQALEALSLLEGVTAFEEIESTPDNSAFEVLPASGTKRQAYLLHFLREKRGTRESARRALGTGSTYGGQEARVSELLRGGWLVETGEYEQTQAGGKTPVIVPTKKARMYVNLAKNDWFPYGIRVEV